jgi:hypothetical protein
MQFFERGFEGRIPRRRDMTRTDYERVCSKLDNTRQKDHPRAYDTLSQPEKEALQYWIEHAIQPATKVDERQSSYGLKYEYKRETKCHVSNAQFKGAMLVAGYLPTKESEQSWHFLIMPRDNEARTSREGAHQNKKGQLQTYRSTPPGEQDPRFDALVQQARESQHGDETYNVML